MGLIWILVVGGLAGWLAGQIMGKGGFGLIGNVLLGVVGAVLGRFLLGLVGLSSTGGFVGSLVTAVVGAVALLFVVGLVRRA